METRAAATAPAAPMLQGAPRVAGVHGAARPAVRCGECHAAMHAEWAASGHADANRSPMYLAMRSRTDRAACDPCHAPLHGLVEPGAIAADEGITCEVCHTMTNIDVTGARATMELNLAENVQRGTICDAQEHYFHKTACSPLFRESRLCAGCHRWSMTTAGGAQLRILTEYDEWLASRAAEAGVTCQRCHMPVADGEIATGWKRRAPLGHHGTLGAGGALRPTALSLRVTVEDRDGAVHVAAAVANAAGGHAMPTGLPGRQIVLRVAIEDAAGGAIAQQERAYGRVLVDAAGAEVPFHAAVAQASDNRIGERETRSEVFSFAAAGAGALVARLVWRSASPAIAAALGVPAEEELLQEARVPFGPPRPGHGRARLPASAEGRAKP